MLAVGYRWKWKLDKLPEIHVKQLSSWIFKLISFAVIDRAISPAILRIQNALIVFENVKFPKLIMRRADESEVWLGLRVCFDVPGEHITVAECNYGMSARLFKSFVSVYDSKWVGIQQDLPLCSLPSQGIQPRPTPAASRGGSGEWPSAWRAFRYQPTPLFWLPEELLAFTRKIPSNPCWP